MVTSPLVSMLIHSVSRCGLVESVNQMPWVGFPVFWLVPTCSTLETVTLAPFDLSSI